MSKTGFKLWTDPLFVDKIVDIVGLYRRKAVVLCTDESPRCRH